VEAMLRSSGFEIVAHPEAEVYLCRRCERALGIELLEIANARQEVRT
jgi:tRNA (mo5U34)-methyltransferase